MDAYYPVPNNRAGLCHMLASIKMSRLILLVLVCLLSVSWIVHYSLPSTSDKDIDTHRSRNKLDAIEDLGSLKTTDLKFRIEELKRIKASVNNELRELESKRQKLHSEISHYNTQIEMLKNTYEKNTGELDQLRVSIDNTKTEQAEIDRKNAPLMEAPKRVLPSLSDATHLSPPPLQTHCKMHNCFDYSRCPLTSGFPVYFYNPEEYVFSSAPPLDTFIKLSVIHAIDTSAYMTFDAHIACVFIVIIGDVEGGIRNTTDLSLKLRQLPYWHGDGRNHILLNLARYHGSQDAFYGVNTGRAMVVQSTFLDTFYRPDFDVVVPPSIGISYGDVWDQLPSIVPAHRKHLLSFHGEFSMLGGQVGSEFLSKGSKWNNKHEGDSLEGVGDVIGDLNGLKGVDSQQIGGGPTPNQSLKFKNLDSFNQHQKQQQQQQQQQQRDPGSVYMDKFLNRKLQSVPNSAVTSVSDAELLLEQDRIIVDTLKRMQQDYADFGFNFKFSCDKGERLEGANGEWSLCGPDSQREDVLRASTFSLIIAPTNHSVLSTTLTQIRLYEALKFGAIPVVLGGDRLLLPFSSLLDWRRAAVLLPKPRVTELHYVIRSLGHSDILDMRRQGRILWESYFGTTKSIMDTLLAVVRTRLGIPPAPVEDIQFPSVFNESFVPLKDDNIESVAEAEEGLLGPIEAPFPSPKFLRNFTSWTRPEMWNEPQHPFHLFPATPFEPVMPAEAKFIGSTYGFRPIGRGAGGAGKEFSEALGGNYPREQFTVVMLTYEREAVLLNAISRLKGLPHLNKVIVVWNSPKQPQDDLRWPEIGVPVEVLKMSKNSLNNRFLPFDEIETDAVLSIDDDAHLRHDEIIFGFRVWREARDRIVGFPGRFHAWDVDHESWLYNSNYSCELSMVLTGAAFYHKYYSYVYSRVMAQAIRDKVDEYLNCEDLALNFLVSHMTRKPPIKVTSRWTFRCPGCPQALSVDDEHFHERHKCMQFFVQVYGYMPLLNTQFRADSVLFKTRIPHDKQKCFKFI